MTRATIGSQQVFCRDECVKKSSNEHAKSVTSDGNFEQNVVEDGSR